MLDSTTKKHKGRVAKFDPEYVRDLSAEYLRDYYRRKPEVFAKLAARDPNLVASIRKLRAVFLDSFTRRYLEAVEYGDPNVDEICYRIYVDFMRQESPDSPATLIAELADAVKQDEWRRNALCYRERVTNYMLAHKRLEFGTPTVLVQPERNDNTVVAEPLDDDDGFF